MYKEQVIELLKEKDLKWEDFYDWMKGQTIGMDGNKIIYYNHDVARYIRWKVDGKPTYWD